jgi:nucleoid-associated protein YgaU
MEIYTTKSGDTWDVIAKEVYEDEYKADVLMAANPEQVGTFIFGAGEQITVPELEEENDGSSSLPPWKNEEDDDD